MSITLNIDCPDHLKTVFDETPFLKVLNDKNNVARDVLLLWLLEAHQGLWLSQFPDNAKQALQHKLEIYPKLRFDHLKFAVPGELRGTSFDRCVIEDLEYDERLTWASSIRIIEQESLTPLNALGFKLEERKELLARIRMGDNVQFDEYELIASICRESLFEYVKEFWSDVIAEEPVWNWHIKYLADELQYIAERVFKGQPKEYDLVINVPPGSTKSTLCSIMFPGWTWTRMPSARFLGGSYTSPLAMDLSRKNKDVVTSEKYRQAFPEVVLRADQRAKSHFVNTKGGSRYSFGVQGTVTGMHAHFIGIDDPLNPEKAISETELATANRVMSETLFTRKVDKSITPTILIMQRLHQNDPTQHVLDTYENVKHICIPAESEDGENIKPAELVKYYTNGLMDPTRLSRQVLDENFKALGEFSYAGQFQQSPVPRGGAMFQPGRILVDTPPSKWKQRIRYWDKAGSQGKGAFTAGVLMGRCLDDRYWILDVVRGQWAMDERESTIKHTAQSDGKEIRVWVEQEPGSGGKDQASYTVKSLAGWNISADKVGGGSGNKAMRAGPFAAQVNGGNVVMVQAGWNKAYLDELRYFPVSKYKDQVDASSGAFNHLVKGEIRVGRI